LEKGQRKVVGQFVAVVLAAEEETTALAADFYFI